SPSRTPPSSPTETATASPSRTVTPSATRTATRSPSPTETFLPTVTSSPSASPTGPPTASPAPAPSGTPRPSPTARSGVPSLLDRAPRPVVRIQPIYPPKALRDRARGTVVLTVHVDAAGVPMKADVKHGVRSDIDAAAVAAAMQWRFEPARKEGVAV